MSAQGIGNHLHRIGETYRTARADDPALSLQAAEESARLLREIEFTRDGCLDWDTAVGDMTLALVCPDLAAYGKGERPDELRNVSLYNGTAGIVHGLLCLHRATGREDLRGQAAAGLATLCRLWKSALTYRHIASKEANFGYFFGIGGVMAVLKEGWNTLGDGACRDALISIVRELGSLAQPTAHGVRWTGRTGLMGDAGALLALADLSQQDEEARGLALAAGDELLSTGEAAGRGMRFERGGDPQEEHPNFVYGTAGTGFAFARLYERTGEMRFLEGAQAAARYLEDLSVPAGEGCLIPYVVGAEPPIFYLNTCHGPAGTGRLFLTLHRLTGQARYLDFAQALWQGMRHLGAPERMSETLWNNVSHCCGTAGILHYALQLHAATGEGECLEAARCCGEILLGERERTEGGASCWPMAFIRVRPQDVDVKAGLYDAGMGVACALATLHAALTGRENPEYPLTDDPAL